MKLVKKETTFALGNLAYFSVQLYNKYPSLWTLCPKFKQGQLTGLRICKSIEQGSACVVINGICNLYSKSSLFTERDINSLYAQARWFYNAHKDNLSSSRTWEIIKCELPFSKSTPPVACFLPILLMLINKIVYFRSQQLLSIIRMMQRTQLLALTGNSWTCEMNPLDDIRRFLHLNRQAPYP